MLVDQLKEKGYHVSGTEYSINIWLHGNHLCTLSRETRRNEWQHIRLGKMCIIKFEEHYENL